MKMTGDDPRDLSDKCPNISQDGTDPFRVFNENYSFITF